MCVRTFRRVFVDCVLVGQLLPRMSLFLDNVCDGRDGK